MTPPLVADTGGLLRALARRPDDRPTWPAFERALREARTVVVPALVMAEIDYFLRDARAAMRRLVADIFDPATRYDFEPAVPVDVVRGLQIDARFRELRLGLVDGMVGSGRGTANDSPRPDDRPP